MKSEIISGTCEICKKENVQLHIMHDNHCEKLVEALEAILQHGGDIGQNCTEQNIAREALVAFRDRGK